nr:hypothetical protein Iba_chr15eCG4660 [Ipomoea batatas]
MSRLFVQLPKFQYFFAALLSAQCMAEPKANSHTYPQKQLCLKWVENVDQFLLKMEHFSQLLQPEFLLLELTSQPRQNLNSPKCCQLQFWDSETQAYFLMLEGWVASNDLVELTLRGSRLESGGSEVDISDIDELTAFETETAITSGGILAIRISRDSTPLSPSDIKAPIMEIICSTRLGALTATGTFWGTPLT